MRKLVSVIALLLMLSATAIMFLPTWASAWEGGASGRTLRYQPWFAAPIGFGDVVPIICLILTLAAIVGVTIGAIRARVNWPSIALGVLISLLLVLFGYDQDRASFVHGLGAWVAPLVAVGTVLLLVDRLWLSRTRPATPQQRVGA